MTRRECLEAAWSRAVLLYDVPFLVVQPTPPAPQNHHLKTKYLPNALATDHKDTLRQTDTPSPRAAVKNDRRPLRLPPEKVQRGSGT